MNSNGAHEICFLEFVNNKNAKGTRIWPLDCSYSTKSGLTSVKYEKQIKCAINLHCHVLLGWHPTLLKLTKSSYENMHTNFKGTSNVVHNKFMISLCLL